MNETEVVVCLFKGFWVIPRPWTPKREGEGEKEKEKEGGRNTFQNVLQLKNKIVNYVEKYSPTSKSQGCLR